MKSHGINRRIFGILSLRVFAIFPMALFSATSPGLLSQQSSNINTVSINDFNPEHFDKYLAQAMDGDKNAQYLVGYAYLTGRGCDKNIGKSIEWCQRAAVQGYLPAIIGLLDIYENAAPDKAKLEHWTMMGAEQGDPFCQLMTGLNLAFPDKGKPDFPRAYMWLMLAQDQKFKEARDARKFLGQITSIMNSDQLSKGTSLYREKSIYFLQKRARDRASQGLDPLTGEKPSVLSGRPKTNRP